MVRVRVNTSLGHREMAILSAPHIRQRTKTGNINVFIPKCTTQQNIIYLQLFIYAIYLNFNNSCNLVFVSIVFV